MHTVSFQLSGHLLQGQDWGNIDIIYISYVYKLQKSLYYTHVCMALIKMGDGPLDVCVCGGGCIHVYYIKYIVSFLSYT